MSQTHDGWIFTKTRKFAPNGRLQIGQILAKPFQPEFSLMPTGPLPVPDDVLQDKTEDSNASLSSGHNLKAMFKLWVDLNALPVGADTGIHVEHSNTLSWHIDSLKSTQISPTLQYVQASMQYGEVPGHLKTWRWDKRVFMVTGVTIAEGARMVKSDLRSAGAHASAKADLSGVGLSTAGGAGQLESKDTNTEKLGGASNFVFAYSLNEVFYRKITHKPFRKGEVQSLQEDGSKEPEDGADEVDDVVVDDVAEEHYQGEDKDIDEEADDDDINL
jgi:hypothetical protein